MWGHHPLPSPPQPHPARLYPARFLSYLLRVLEPRDEVQATGTTTLAGPPARTGTGTRTVRGVEDGTGREAPMGCRTDRGRVGHGSFPVPLLSPRPCPSSTPPSSISPRVVSPLPSAGPREVDECKEPLDLFVRPRRLLLSGVHGVAVLVERAAVARRVGRPEPSPRPASPSPDHPPNPALNPHPRDPLPSSLPFPPPSLCSLAFLQSLIVDPFGPENRGGSRGGGRPAEEVGRGGVGVGRGGTSLFRPSLSGPTRRSNGK